MPLQHLQHFLIQTEDLEKTKDWYVDVLGMRVGPHPDFKFPVYWLYLGDNDVLHVTQGGAKVSENRVRYLGQESTATVGSGVVDHVAFRATGLIDLIEHLKQGHRFQGAPRQQPGPLPAVSHRSQRRQDRAQFRGRRSGWPPAGTDGDGAASLTWAKRKRAHQFLLRQLPRKR
jgi:catechol 2,3-dioxygenase-like lactoylglutathione lyase family enzyme